MRVPASRSLLLLCLTGLTGLALPAAFAAAGPTAQLSATARAVEAAEHAPPQRLAPEAARMTTPTPTPRSAAEARRILEASTLPGPASAGPASAPAAAPSTVVTASGGIAIDVLDRLAPEQSGERLSLWLEGRRVADFELGDDSRAVWAHVPLPTPGRLRYELRGTSDTEARGERHLSGRGCVVVDHGRRYGIARHGAQLALLPIGAAR